jgi:hypothetical protein
MPPSEAQDHDKLGFTISEAKQEIPVGGRGANGHFARQDRCLGDVRFGSKADVVRLMSAKCH